MVNLLVNRDSVCMGDDVEDHRLQIFMGNDWTFSRLIDELKKLRFFPFVSGNDVVWVLFLNCLDLISFATQSDKVYSRFVDCDPLVINHILNGEVNELRFQYYSSPIKRAEYIYKKFKGLKFHIWHEGFMSEYEAYRISEEQEAKWTIEISCSK